MKRERQGDENLPLSFPEVSFERQALTLKRMSFDRWLELGKLLAQIEGAVQFWIGDYLNTGEKAYGEKYSQAVDERQAEKWRHYAWVSRSVEKCLRKHISLSYKHYEAVAPLDPKDQAKWLSDAVENKWTVHTLREQIALFRKPEPKIDWQEPADPPEVTTEVEEYEEIGERIFSTDRPSVDADFRHLLGICKALRLAEKGNLATGQKPNEEDALRLRTALDVFIASHDRREE